MTRGRNPLPIETKRKRGTLRPDRMPAVAPLTVVPAIQPEGWQLEPEQALDRVLNAGVSWIADTDSPTVSLLRKALELHRRAWEAGSIRDVIEAQKNAAALLSQLGFNPAERSRLGLAAVATVSRLEAMRARTQMGNKGTVRRAKSG